jgi:hypothetical protein
MDDMATEKAPAKTARQKKLDGIMRKIAMFAVQDTYTDEGPAQRALSVAIANLEEAQKLLQGE